MVDFGPKEIQKNHITVLYEDKDNQVSWYIDTPIEDVRFAILCACDSLADGEFEILDFQAKKVNLDEINEFKNNSIFFLRKKHNKPTNILLDGNRKLYVEIEPMQHLESQVAVKYMVVYNMFR